LVLKGREWKEGVEGCIMRSFITWYSSADIIRAIKSGRMRWVGHVARMGEMRNSYNISLKPKGKNHSEDLGVDGKIISEWILEKVEKFELDAYDSG
jgi:hypothetical protein